MNITRRVFLSSATTVVLGYLLLSHGAFAQMALQRPGITGRAAFEARIRDWFYVFNADATHQSNLQLLRVINYECDPRLEQFTLVLCSGLMDVALPTRLYDVAGERFRLFLQHADEQDGQQFYCATFARLRW